MIRRHKIRPGIWPASSSRANPITGHPTSNPQEPPTTDTTLFIVNPHSGAGRTTRLWRKYENEITPLFERVEVRITEGPNHASEIARHAVKQGYKRIIPVGGDGTLNEVVNGYFEHDRLISMQTSLGIIPTGTGCDFARNLSVPAGVVEAARFIAHNQAKPCDIGRATFITSGIAQTRYFINVGDVGLGGTVVETVNHSGKHLGGQLSFLLATLKGLIRYTPLPLKLFIDGQPVSMGERQLLIAVANGKYFGAGMCIGESARVDDGQFDIIAADSMRPIELLTSLAALKRGRTPASPRIRYLRGKEIRIECDERVPIDLDGELAGFGSVTFSMLPARIPVIGIER